MTHEVAIDRDLYTVDVKGAGALPFGFLVAGRLAGPALAQEEDVGHDGRTFTLECLGGETDSPDEVGPRSEILADCGILLVEREMGRHKREHAVGPQGIDGLGEKEIVQ